MDKIDLIETIKGFIKETIENKKKTKEEKERDKKINYDMEELDCIIERLREYEQFEKNIIACDTDENKNTIICNEAMKLEWNNFVCQFKEFCKLWVEKENLCPKFEFEKEILNLYYKSDRILDLLERINFYIDDLVDNEDPYIASAACYNNYIYFLENFINKLRDKYQNFNSAQNVSVYLDKKTKQWIIENECKELKINNIKYNIDLAERLKEKLATQKYNSGDSDAQKGLIDYLKELKSGDCFKKDAEKLQLKTSQLKEQIKYMNEEIVKAESLYDVLNDVFTTEWFQQFKPKDDNEEITCVELKEFLRQSMSDVNEKILKVYTRH